MNKMKGTLVNLGDVSLDDAVDTLVAEGRFQSCVRGIDCKTCPLNWTCADFQPASTQNSLWDPSFTSSPTALASQKENIQSLITKIPLIPLGAADQKTPLLPIPSPIETPAQSTLYKGNGKGSHIPPTFRSYTIPGKGYASLLSIDEKGVLVSRRVYGHLLDNLAAGTPLFPTHEKATGSNEEIIPANNEVIAIVGNESVALADEDVLILVDDRAAVAIENQESNQKNEGNADE